ncbi:MAG TPA: LCP family protein [Firmicutes bacterium]|jgi:LCP family protein required for cell wall assembly|nr:LCP family protein [Bacillota bacterium]
MKRAVTILLILILIGAGACGVTSYVEYKNTLEKMTVPEDQNNQEEGETGLIENQKLVDPFAILLFGISEREAFNDPGHSDTIMLALVDPEPAKVHLISIPRDAYVDIPGFGKDRINTAYPRGGPALLMETLENWLDLDIYAYASINFQGFIDLVDLVGGIEVYVPREMHYDDPVDGTSIHLGKGEKLLDGKDALGFVRFRKSNDGIHDSDYQRMERQQLALSLLADKLSSIRTLTKISRIMEILSANVKTSLKADELDALIKSFLSFKIDNLQTTSIQGGGHLINEAWYEIVTEEEKGRIQNIIQDFMEGSN